MTACFGIVTVALAPEISTFSGARPTSLVRRLADGVGVSAGVAASPAGVPYTSSSHNE